MKIRNISQYDDTSASAYAHFSLEQIHASYFFTYSNYIQMFLILTPYRTWIYHRLLYIYVYTLVFNRNIYIIPMFRDTKLGPVLQRISNCYHFQPPCVWPSIPDGLWQTRMHLPYCPLVVNLAGLLYMDSMPWRHNQMSRNVNLENQNAYVICHVGP